MQSLPHHLYFGKTALKPRKRWIPFPKEIGVEHDNFIVVVEI